MLNAHCYVADNLQTMQKQWESTVLPQLEHKSFKLWHQGRNPGRISIWQGDAEHYRCQVVKLVHEVAMPVLGKAKLPVKNIKKGCQGIQQMWANLQEVLFKLRLADMPQEPPKPSRKCPAPARSVACSCMFTLIVSSWPCSFGYVV